MPNVIYTQSLSYSYGATNAVIDLNLSIPEGAICAFLGPNGAGKSTTIRLLLGLLSPDRGICEVLGRPPGHRDALACIGALVESPSLYDHLTGQENVEITRLLRGEPRSETSRVLALVGLASDANRPVLTYSMGMRQRLGLALALMGSPRLLILDEPTNGLDPSGIQEIRALIRSLPQNTGASVFLSSHLLAEVEQVADDVIIINRGRLRYGGPLSAFETSSKPELHLKVDDNPKAIDIIVGLGYSADLRQGHIVAHAPEAESPRIAKAIINREIALYQITPYRPNLEERFLAMLERDE